MEPLPNSGDSGAAVPPGADADGTPSAGAETQRPPGAAGVDQTPPSPRRGRRIALWAGVIVGLLLVAVGFELAGTGFVYEPFRAEPRVSADKVPADAKGLDRYTKKLQTRERDLNSRLKAAAPHDAYIVIDQTQNRIYLKKENQTLLEAVCSAGSGMVLKETTGKKREWVFDTPRGQFEVQNRIQNPVWRKPDWAFVEENEPIPKNNADRMESGSLGEYALYLGHGYMIHGTLYERLLGRAVSHGCVRVGKDDLRKIWASTKIGTHVYIY
jgi:lipoprotein-anchoring transpeptidase ErfK/SrfK